MTLAGQSIDALSTLLLLGLAMLLAIPAGVLLLEVLAARRGQATSAAGRVASAGVSGIVSGAEGERPTVAIVMPAHDEAGGIARTIASVRAQLRAGDRLLVVADNCNDDTAAVARAAGADVIERHDDARRGKGFALDFGVRQLEADERAGRGAPGLVAIIDADCLLEPLALDRLARASAASGRPVQASYLMRHTAENTNVASRISEFAWLVKNHVRPLGGAALGWPCSLYGTGMMFPWSVMRSAALANGNLVEDMKLAVDLTAAGKPPLFVADAGVGSTFAATAAGQTGQRTRWEHGHLQVIFGEVPRLIATAIGRRDTAALALAFDLSVPPLALLLMLTVAVFGASMLLLVLHALTGSSWLVTSAAASLISAVSLAAVAVAVTAAWSSFARSVLPASALRSVPRYALAKLSVYTGFVSSRQTAWVRARRDHEAD